MLNRIIRLGVLYLTLTSAAAPSIITSLPGAVVVDGKTAGLPTLTLDRSMTLTRHVGLLTRAASLSLLACSVPAKSGGLDPAELTSIEVTPTSVTMAPNTSQVFAAQGFWSDGSHGTVPVTWTVSGGSMAANGTYTASADAGDLRGARGLSGRWLRRLGRGDGRLQRCASTSASDTTPELARCHPRDRDAQSGREEDLRSRGTMVGFGRASGDRPVELDGRHRLEQRFLHCRPDRRQFRSAGLCVGTSIGDSATVEIRDSTSPPSPQWSLLMSLQLA